MLSQNWATSPVRYRTTTFWRTSLPAFVSESDFTSMIVFTQKRNMLSFWNKCRIEKTNAATNFLKFLIHCFLCIRIGGAAIEHQQLEQFYQLINNTL
jgi:hypothetical protein